MSRLKMFCTSHELTGWLRQLCAGRRLGGLLFAMGDAGEPLGRIATRPGELSLEGVNLPCFFFPLPGPSAVPSYGDARPLEQHWLTLWPGGELQSETGPVLAYSELYAPPQADADLQWLKRRVKKVLQAGVVGRIDNLGGEATYRDYFHSAEARRLLGSGFKWRQFRDGSVSFEPLPPSSARPV